MKIQSSICTLAYKGNPLLSNFVSSNGIKGAFVHKEDKRKWQVLEGKPDEQTGFHAATFTPRREAKQFAEEIDSLLREIGVIKVKPKFPLIKEIRALLISLKSDICDDYRASDDPDDNTPAICVTIGANEKGEWDYQTGDNSYTGGAYGFPHWAVITLERRSNSTELARDVINQLADLMAQ